MSSVKKMVLRKGEAGEWAKNRERMAGLGDEFRRRREQARGKQMVGQAKEPVRKTGIKFTGNEACSEAAGSGALGEPPAEESDLDRK